MVDGRLQVEGQSDAAAAAEKLEWKRQEEMTDALGNVVRARALSFALMDRGLRCCVLDTSYACLHGCQRLPAALLPGHDRLRGSGLTYIRDQRLAVKLCGAYMQHSSARGRLPSSNVAREGRPLLGRTRGVCQARFKRQTAVGDWRRTGAAQIKIKAPKKKLSNKEKKQRERVRKAKIARGEEVSDSEEDE